MPKRLCVHLIGTSNMRTNGKTSLSINQSLSICLFIVGLALTYMSGCRAASHQGSVRLSNGLEMPRLGLGTTMLNGKKGKAALMQDDMLNVDMPVGSAQGKHQTQRGSKTS